MKCITAVRSGDYYLFEDLDEKVELDLIHERPSAGIEDAMTDKKLNDKLTIEQVRDSGHCDHRRMYIRVLDLTMFVCGRIVSCDGLGSFILML